MHITKSNVTAQCNIFQAFVPSMMTGSARLFDHHSLLEREGRNKSQNALSKIQL